MWRHSNCACLSTKRLYDNCWLRVIYRRIIMHKEGVHGFFWKSAPKCSILRIFSETPFSFRRKCRVPQIPVVLIVTNAMRPERRKCRMPQMSGPPVVPDVANVRMSQIRKYRGSGYRKCPYVDYYKCASQRHEKKEKIRKNDDEKTYEIIDIPIVCK